jgi:putative tricarboxylic transport membrane protein
MVVRRAEGMASVIMAIFSLAYLFGAFRIPQPMLKAQIGPDVFPKVVGALMLLLSVIFIIQQISGKIKEDAKRAEIIGSEGKVETKADFKIMGIMIGLMLAYALLFDFLGYPVTTFLVFVVGVFVLDRRHMLRDTIIAFLASFGLYAIFFYVLRVNLPPGLLALIVQ